MVFENKIGKL